MDVAFVTGMGAFVSSVIIFIGAAFLLLMLVIGARLAYWVTASISLAFTLIMAVVWSINPLGPVGQLPEWDAIDIGTNVEALEFNAAAQYPDDPWHEPKPDDQVQLTQAAELESGAAEQYELALDEGDLKFDVSDAIITAEDATYLLEQGDTTYGLTRLEVQNAVGDKVGEVAVVMEYDPGNPLGQARMITLGTLVLFVLHLFGLSRAEKKVKEERPEGLV